MWVQTLRVIVFGRDTSRGGTTAIVVPDFGPSTVDSAIDQYAQGFGISDSPESWAACRALAWDDALFCAELQAGEILPMGTDLEDDEGLSVLIDDAPRALARVDATAALYATRVRPVQLEAVRLSPGERAELISRRRHADVGFWRRFSQTLGRPSHPRWDDGDFSFRLEALPPVAIELDAWQWSAGAR
jgi:hypothetical protein